MSVILKGEKLVAIRYWGWGGGANLGFFYSVCENIEVVLTPLQSQ